MRINETEDENGWEWYKIQYAFKGDLIGGFHISDDGYVITHHTQGRAPDGGTYAETSTDVFAWGIETEDEAFRCLMMR